MTAEPFDLVFTDYFSEYSHMRTKYKEEPIMSMDRYRRGDDYEPAFQDDLDSFNSPLSEDERLLSRDVELGDVRKTEQPEWIIILHQVKADMQKIRVTCTFV
jgi:hypothetical protein